MVLFYKKVVKKMNKPNPTERRFHAEVKFIFDGDTFEIKEVNGPETHRIRLYGIDAPERGQEYGGIVQHILQKRVLNQIVEVELTKTAHKGREVAILWVNGKCLNLTMIEEGLAWKSLQYNDKYAAGFIKAEIDARVARRGIWSRPNPEEPYMYRKRVDLEKPDHYKEAVQRDRVEVQQYLETLNNVKPNSRYISVPNSSYHNDNKYPSIDTMVSMFNHVKEKIKSVRDIKLDLKKMLNRKNSIVSQVSDPLEVKEKEVEKISANEAVRNLRNRKNSPK